VASVFWTDMRSGRADIYGAASNAGPWTNVPIVTAAGDQTQPAVAAGAGTALHLVWADNRSGNNDIWYAVLNGLPSTTVTGVNIVDDTSGADQTAPTLVCSDNQKVFVCWTDSRHTSTTDMDTDLYVAELRAGAAGTNIFVGDDGTNANQNDPALGVDQYGQPYIVWTDSRLTTAQIYGAMATFDDPTPLDSQNVVASTGAVVGTNPAAIQAVEDVSVVVPAGACPADLRIGIFDVLHPPVSAVVLLGSYEFSPSGAVFNQPVTVTIPYATSSNSRALPYWYDSVTGALSQQVITDVQNIRLSSKLSALQFRTTHFTPYYVIQADAEGMPLGDSSGGCALSPSGYGSAVEFLAPYVVLAAIMIALRWRDAKRHGPMRR